MSSLSSSFSPSESKKDAMSLERVNHPMVLRWMQICLVLVFAMIILGGVTRLTDSGLSMVYWKPTGMLPPMTEQQWLAELNLYRESPEYQKINRGMSVDEFKTIFWFEYSHRMLGRLIGLVFFLPLVYFAIKKYIRPALMPRLVFMLFLGGFQGLLGWYMVQSGLVDNPHVSHYRLAAHKLSALLIFGFILWTVLDLRRSEPYQRIADSTVKSARRIAMGLLTLVVITIGSGAFVAGLKAGLIFNTFPLMGGQLIPEGIGALSPWYMNPLENMTTIQFQHRWLATLTAVLLLAWYWYGRARWEDQRVSRSFKLVGMMVLIQWILGISTLLMHVPISLAAMHQAGGVLLFSVLLFNLHALSRR